MFGGGMSIIFFKTKGKDFWGDAVAVLPLGSSSVAIAASPGIVPCRAPSTPRRRCFFFFTESCVRKTGTQEPRLAAGLDTIADFEPFKPKMQISRVKNNTTPSLFFSLPTEHARWIFRSSVPRLFHAIVAADWLSVLHIWIYYCSFILTLICGSSTFGHWPQTHKEIMALHRRKKKTDPISATWMQHSASCSHHINIFIRRR